ncbi:MAG: hypothetical protein WCR31_07235, partial [Treponema sp.]
RQDIFHIKKKKNKWGGNKNDRLLYYFDVEKCRNCPFKNVHGYDTAVGSGLDNMKMQGACTIFVVNLKRIFTLMEEKQ